MKKLLCICVSFIISTNLFSQVQIGDFAYGGIVFYVDESGENGLVCAPSNLTGEDDWEWDGFQWMDITVSGNQYIQ